MTLFLSLLPVYLFGNLHCMGMCGPLVMLLGQHRYRFFYFLGRLSSFSLAGMLAGELGSVLHLFLKHYFLAEIVSLICGSAMIGWGIFKTFHQGTASSSSTARSLLRPLHRWTANLMLKDSAAAVFLFGFFTVALPCGQTLLVFSACALSGSGWVGLFNGFAFALLTTPSLVLSMHALTFLKRYKHYDRAVLGICSIAVGILACCRGLAEIGWIPHLVLNPDASSSYHLVIY